MEAGHAQLDAVGIAWRLGATLFFVVLNGFFVAAEFALVKVRGIRVEALVSEGRRGARTVHHVHQHLDRYLSACQLGITLASLILGALGEPAVSVLLIAAFGAAGFAVSGATWLPVLSIGLAFFVITMLHMTIGEQAPKMWAIRRAEGTALATAPALRAFYWIFAPLITGINSISNWMLRLVGLPAGGHHEEIHDPEEIRSILSLSADAGRISEREYELTENVFRLTQLEVRHIIVPRSEIETLTLDRSIEENLRTIRETGHSRYPLSETGLDPILGFVHTRDLLAAALDASAIDLRGVARDPLVVPDTMALSRFITELQTCNAHCAVVVDERGTVIGYAFREDALEEVVGPLGDEFDPRPEHGFREVGPGVFESIGSVPLPEVLDRLGFALSDEEREDEDTLGGHVTARLGRLAKRGDVVRMGPYRAEVVEASPHRVERLRLRRASESDPQAGAEKTTPGPGGELGGDTPRD